MRRKKHKWVLILMFPLSEKEAASATDADDGRPPIELTPDRLKGSLIYCQTCKEPFAAGRETWCPGERDTYEIPLP